jgi:hypothetical protein
VVRHSGEVSIRLLTTGSQCSCHWPRRLIIEQDNDFVEEISIDERPIRKHCIQSSIFAQSECSLQVALAQPGQSYVCQRGREYVVDE